MSEVRPAVLGISGRDPSDGAGIQAGGFAMLAHLNSLRFDLIPKRFQHLQNQILNVIGRFYIISFIAT